MKIQYAKKYVQKLGLVYSTTRVYQFIYDKNDIDDTKRIQYFIMHGMVLCIKVDSYVVNMLYSCSLSHNK